MRWAFTRAAVPAIAMLALTALTVAFVTRFILERISLEGLVLNLILRNRDPYLGMPLADAVAVSMARSLVLIILATSLAMLVGFVLAIFHFAARHRLVRAVAWSLGTVAVSLPSFFWAMLLQLVAITWFLLTGRGLVPTAGFGLDEHLVLPTIALMARPAAYVFRTTATAFEEIASRDYVRTAEAKGLGARLVLTRHIFPNARPTFFAGADYASRSVLSSLAIVEYIFVWNGAGLAFIYAIANRNVDFAMALAVSFATLFVLLSVVLAAFSRNTPEQAVAPA